MADADRLAAFVAGLPEGKRHRGFFWAAMTAVAEGAATGPIAAAAEQNGLDREYVERTLAEARKEHGQSET